MFDKNFIIGNTTMIKINLLKAPLNYLEGLLIKIRFF